MNIQNQTLENEEIVINDKKTFNAIGDEVTLINCTVYVSVPAKDVAISCKMIGGELVAKREMFG